MKMFRNKDHKKLLIVEDDKITADYISEVVRGYGYEAELAETAKEAIERVRDAVPDLIIIDIMLLGGIDGVEAAEKIQQEYDVPVIYLTAHDVAAQFERAEITQPFSYLLKPLNKREIHLTIEMALHRHELEQELKKRNEHLAEAQIIGEMGSWDWDIVNNHLHWSDNIYRIFGLLPQSFAASYEAFIQSVHPDDQEMVQVAVDAALKGQGQGRYQITHRIILPNGDERFVEERAEVKFYEDGNPVHMLGTVRDRTAHLVAEQDKADMISMITHELRTPLTSIRGALGLVNSGQVGDVSDKAKSVLEIAHRNTDRLLSLIGDLLDSDKMSSGKMKFQMERLDLADLLREQAEAEKGFGDEHGVTLSLTGTNHPIWITGDKDRLMQVMANLTSNAVKFSQKGDRVDIALEKVGAGKIRVSVKDYGSGIPEDARATIFEKFSQAETQGLNNVEGTGLGLNVAKLIVEEHGGTIGFTSDIGKGTTFYFDLQKLQTEA